jgi:hypothetical protein
MSAIADTPEHMFGVNNGFQALPDIVNSVSGVGCEQGWAVASLQALSLILLPLLPLPSSLLPKPVLRLHQWSHPLYAREVNRGPLTQAGTLTHNVCICMSVCVSGCSIVYMRVICVVCLCGVVLPWCV